MRKVLLIAGLAVLASCGAGNKEKKGDLTAKQTELQELKGQQVKITDQIKKLEDEIAKLDPSTVKIKTKLVSVTPVTSQSFTHYIDLQGKIDADETVVVAPRAGMGGSSSVTAIYIKKGDMVKAGQVLLLTDASVLKQQMAQLETQLSFAQDIYKRQQNLWNQNIGTEVQLLTAKNNVEAVNRQILTLKEQIALTRITAPISGVVEELNVKVGETFQGYLGAVPQIKIINTRKGLKVMSDIPENYASKVKVGTPVEIVIPDISKNIKSTISLVGQSIGLTSRAFNVESKIPFDAALKPNQLAQMRIQDYMNPKAFVVPVNVVQTDEKGKYVFVMVVENNQKIARRKVVTIGEMYSSNIEVTTGLTEGDQVITQGYQSLYEGQPLETGAN